MIEWVQELRADLAAEFGTGPQIMSVATVDADGRPHVRSVVCRRIEGPMLLIASDARSAKNQQIAGRPRVEGCFWLPKLRRQYRLAGSALVLGAGRSTVGNVDLKMDDEMLKLREEVWADLSDTARALFHWPDPGRTRVPDPSLFPQAVRTGLPPDTFEVIALTPSGVESLDLRPHPHRRRRWRATTHAATWAAEDLNP